MKIDAIASIIIKFWVHISRGNAMKTMSNWYYAVYQLNVDCFWNWKFPSTLEKPRSSVMFVDILCELLLAAE